MSRFDQFPGLRRLMRIVARRRSVDREVDDELQFHLLSRAADLELRGVAPEEARRRALEEFGDVDAARVELQAIDRPAAVARDATDWLADLGTDLRLSVRRLRREPGFAIVSLLMLSLGIGVNVAIGSLAHAALIRPLPYERAERLFHFWESKAGDPADRSEASYPDFLDLRSQGRDVLEGLEAYDPRNLTVSLNGQASRVRAASVTPGFLPLLGARPASGRLFAEDENVAGGAPVAVLSDRYWRTAFGGGDVLGQPLILDGRPHTIVGIAEPGFSFALRGDPEIWIPLDAGVRQREQRSFHWANAVGRLRDGVTLRQAAARLDAVMAALAAEYPESNAGRGAVLVPLRDEIVGDVRPIVLGLFVAVGLVLLVACANLASLSLARGLARQRELAVRAALGASRSRLRRLVLTESLLLAFVGGALGALLAGPAARLLLGAVPAGLLVNHPYLAANGLEPALIGYAAVLTVLTGLAFGAAPAIAAARPSREGAGVGGRSVVSGDRSRLRRGLVVAQIALTAALLAGGGLLGRSFAALVGQDMGFRSEGLLTTRLALPDSRYGTFAARLQYFDAAVAAARALPGVVGVGAVNNIPLRGGGTIAFRIEGEPEPDQAARPEATFRAVAGDYFDVMGIPLVAGRWPDARDRSSSPAVLLVSRGVADRLLPGRSIVGRRVRFYVFPDTTFEVIGVAGDVKTAALDADPPFTIYMPNAQSGENRMTLVLRTAGDPNLLALPLGRALAALDPEVPPYDMTTMADHVAGSAAVVARRLPLLLVAALGGLALLLAVVGIYGVTAYQVAQRHRELGVRLALGATAMRVVRQVVAGGAAVAGLGIALGLGGALLLARWFTGLLFGVGPADPVVFGLVGGVMALVSVTACWIPARRAGRVDPGVALRAD